MTMRWMKTATTLGTVVGALAVGACDDATTAPGDMETDGLSFTYHNGATYKASGMPAFEGGDLSGGMFAIALPDSLGGVVITAFDAREGTVGDLLILQLAELAVDVFGPCDALVGGDCHGRIIADIDATTLEVSGGHWELVGGNVEVLIAAPDRVAGSFDGLVLRLQGDPAEERVLGEGVFDLPLMSEAEGAAAMKCILARSTGASAC